MGQLFKRWLDKGSLGVKPVSEKSFLRNKKDAILDGSDESLKFFAKEYLGYEREKGLDFVGRFNNTYVIALAKFISDERGHQNDQFLDAITTIDSKVVRGVRKVAILDGVLYIPSRRKLYK